MGRNGGRSWLSAGRHPQWGIDFYIGLGLPKDNSTMSYVVVLLMAIDVVWWLLLSGLSPSSLREPLPLPLYQMG
jgi:hypothetical protein